MDVLVVVAHRSKQLGEVVIVQGVDDVAAVSPRPDQAQRPEQSQVVRRSAEAKSRGRGELLDGAVAAEKFGQDPQASWRGQCLQCLGQLLGFVSTQLTVSGAMFGGMRHSSRLHT